MLIAEQMPAEKGRKRRAETLRGEDILCFSHDWTGDPLSKTHLMRVLSEDNRILWINSLANRRPTATTGDLGRVLSKLKRFTEPVREVEPNIFVLNPLAVPAYGTALVRRFNRRFLLGQVRRAMRRLGFRNPVNMVFNPAAGLLAGRLGESRLIYYCVDDYTEFTGVAGGLREIEEDLFRRSDLVVVSAEKLLADKKKYNPNTRLIRHGTDWRHFQRAADPETPVPHEIRDLPRPVIGFHGLLADWVDYELIRKVAERFSAGSVVLIGKTALDTGEKIGVIEGLPNVHLLGRRPYERLPDYCRGFDVALNPFIINDLTLAANPLKVREYLAAGRPVVSTDLPEVRRLAHCLVGRDHAEFLERIAEALRYPVAAREISDSVREESWEARVEELRALVAETAGTGAG